MNCDIIDGENTKLRPVSFEDIEKIVDNKFKDIVNDELEYSEEYDDNEYDDDLLCAKMDYEINYLKKDLIHIMNYYNLSYRKKKKSDIIEDIVVFESQPENYFVVDHRKTLWHYLEELENDHYLSKFIVKH